MVNIGNDWDNILKEDFDSESYAALRTFLRNEYTSNTIYPNMLPFGTNRLFPNGKHCGSFISQRCVL